MGWAGVDETGSTITLAPTDDGWVVRWFEADGTANAFDVGHGAWLRSTARWPEPSHLDVAASGGWITPDEFVAHIACLDTPHTAVLTVGSTVGLEWILPPLGPVTLRQLAVPDQA